MASNFGKSPSVNFTARTCPSNTANGKPAAGNKTSPTATLRRAHSLNRLRQLYTPEE